MHDDDPTHMRAALALARRRLGATWPNPAVGCVIVRDGRVVGRGATASGGRPHAETRALAMAGAMANGATAYVTLEPCSHHGQTPPCAEALIAAGVARVVVACGDPDPRVSGRGIARLRAAGIAVDVGLLGEEAWQLNEGFFLRLRAGRPLVTLKLATSLDGRIATSRGESQWITGEAARRAGHALRGDHDAMLVGIGTVLADDPMLTCRIPGYRERPLLRVVLDTRLRIPIEAALVRTAREIPTWIFHAPDADPARREALAGAGMRVFAVAAGVNGLDLPAVLTDLGKAGLTRLLVEGGARVAASLLRERMADRLAWFHAPLVIGGDGLAAVAPLGVEMLAEMPRYMVAGTHGLGHDRLIVAHARGGA